MSVKPPLTHFLCVPLVTSISRSQLQASWQHFKAEVERDPDHDNGLALPPKAVRPLGTLHLTLGVMSLVTPDRIDSALNLLYGLDMTELLPSIREPVDSDSEAGAAVSESVEADGPWERKDGLKGNIAFQEGNDRQAPRRALNIQLSGLHPMHSPSSTSVLYTSPKDPTCRLYPFCLALCKSFTEAGFLIPDSRTLRLHATVVNTIYAKDRRAVKGRARDGKERRGNTKMDARELLKKFEDFIWADGLRLNRVSICEMGAKRVERDGKIEEEYLEIGTMPLPEE